MPALLTSIIFDEKTKDTLMQLMDARGESDIALDTIDAFAHLKRDAIPLRHLPDGIYTVIVSMDLEQDTVAEFTLVQPETLEIIRQETLDLLPVIETALLYQDEYADAASGTLPGCSKAEQKESAARMEEIHIMRAATLKDVLATYIADSDAFGSELLDVVDFATMCYVEDLIINGADLPIGNDQELGNNNALTPDVRAKLNHPLNKHLPPSTLLH